MTSTKELKIISLPKLVRLHRTSAFQPISRENTPYRSLLVKSHKYLTKFTTRKTKINGNITVNEVEDFQFA